MLGATLVGFALHDTLDLTALGYVSGGSATLSGLVLSVNEGGTTDKIAFASGTHFGGARLGPDDGRAQRHRRDAGGWQRVGFRGGTTTAVPSDVVPGVDPIGANRA
jgi:hypothetical protein